MTLEKLKPCPICKRMDTLRIMEGDRVWIECMKGEDACGLSTGFFDTEAEAVAAWNRRDGNCCEKCNSLKKPDCDIRFAIGQLVEDRSYYETQEEKDTLTEVIDWLREVAKE